MDFLPELLPLLELLTLPLDARPTNGKERRKSGK